MGAILRERAAVVGKRRTHCAYSQANIAGREVEPGPNLISLIEVAQLPCTLSPVQTLERDGQGRPH